MIFNKKKYVKREEFDKLAERLELSISYSEDIAKAVNVVYSLYEELTPSDKLKLLRIAKIKEIFNAEQWNNNMGK
jgi:hypothetical protein